MHTFTILLYAYSITLFKEILMLLPLSPTFTDGVIMRLNFRQRAHDLQLLLIHDNLLIAGFEISTLFKLGFLLNTECDKVYL